MAVIQTRPEFVGMVRIPRGTFMMGSDKHYPEEAPAHEVTVDAFWIDVHTVTNAEFMGIVEATGYVTLAEKPADPALYPGAKPELLAPSSVVTGDCLQFQNMVLDGGIADLDSLVHVERVATERELLDIVRRTLLELTKSLATLLLGVPAQDPAFLRRLRFIVDFPRPDADAREKIWRQCLPEGAHLLADAAFRLLARKIDVTGGHVRQITIRAAFIAAAAGSRIDLEHIAQAAKAELAKLGMPAVELDLAAARRAA